MIFKRSKSLPIRERQIKSPLRFHITNDGRCCQGCGGESTYSLLVGAQTGAATMEISAKFLQRTKNSCTMWSSRITSDHIPKGLHFLLQRYLVIHVHQCFSHNSQEMEIAQMMFISWWISGENVAQWNTIIYTLYIHIYTHIYVCVQIYYIYNILYTMEHSYYITYYICHIIHNGILSVLNDHLSLWKKITTSNHHNITTRRDCQSFCKQNRLFLEVLASIEQFKRILHQMLTVVESTCYALGGIVFMCI